jgi:hypothetical protein
VVNVSLVGAAREGREDAGVGLMALDPGVVASIICPVRRRSSPSVPRIQEEDGTIRLAHSALEVRLLRLEGTEGRCGFRPL